MQKTHQELLAALDFWTTYPCNLRECRVGMALLKEWNGRAGIRLDGGKRRIPVTFSPCLLNRGPFPSAQLWTLSLSPVPDGLVTGFGLIGLSENEDRCTPTFLVPAVCYRSPDEIEVEISEPALVSLHERAENFLAPELERRGMDSSALIYSGRICRQVCTTIKNLNNVDNHWRTHWPSAAADHLQNLFPSDAEAIRTAERCLLRLEVQLQSELEVNGEANVKTQPNGWQIYSGEAVYNATKITLSGTRWALLKALVESDKPLTEAQLIEAGWEHDSSVESKTLHNTLSSLRGILRKKLSLSSDGDPIPVVDTGANRAWKIADSLR